MKIKETFNNHDEESPDSNLKFDDAAFEAFFKKYFTPLCGYCQYKFNFDLNLAKEIVHTAFIKLWETRLTISADLSAKAYITRIIINKSLDVLKHEKVRSRHRKYIINNSESQVYQTAFENLDVKQLAADIDKAISQLPPQMRKVFMLSRYEGLKYSAIADQLNISVKTVETQMGRALSKLREKLSGHSSLYLVLLLNGQLLLL